MLPGTVEWPAALAGRYREQGLWDGTTLYDILACAARRDPAKTALVDGGRRSSYADLERDALLLAARLLDLGIAPLDRVVVQLPNVTEFVVVYFALARIGQTIKAATAIKQAATNQKVAWKPV